MCSLGTFCLIGDLIGFDYFCSTLSYCDLYILGFFKTGLAKIYMLSAGWEGHLVKNCYRGLENVCDRGLLNPRSQFFTIRTDPRPANNFFFLRLIGLQLGLRNFVGLV